MAQLRSILKSPPAFAVFRYREYRLFWLAAAFSNIGMWALVNGRLWLMHELSDAPLMLGLVTMSSLAPILALSIWGGVIADRVNRLRLVTVTRGMFSALAVLTGLLIVTGVITPWQLIAISLATGVLLSFDIPSRQAIMPGLVQERHLAGAIAMYSFVTTGSAVLWPLVFAPLVGSVGLEGLFFVIGAAYALTVAVLLLMKPIAPVVAPVGASLWRGLTEGLAYVRSHRIVLALITMGMFIGIFASPYQTLLPIYADEVLGGDIEDFAGLLLGSGVGALVGALVLASLGRPGRLPWILLASGGGFGAALIALGQVSWFPAAVGVMFLLGVCGTLLSTTNSTIVLSTVDDRYRGRVMSIHQWTWGASAFGALLMGGVAQATDVPFALTLGGVVAVAAVAGLMLTVLRRPLFSAPAGLSALPPARRSAGRTEGAPVTAPSRPASASRRTPSVPPGSQPKP